MEGEVISRSEYGGSLPVENVQALASKHLKDIPHRYIRPEVEFDEVSVDDSWQIPVIDMSKLGGTGQLGHDDESEKLHRACKDWGFFQLINHGISETIEEMKKVTEEFFQLSLEEKMTSAQLPNNIEGYGQAFVVSEDQKLDWGDMLFLLPMPASQRNMRFWPTTPTAFRSTLDKYSSELQRVAISLLRLMAKNLRVDPDALSSLFEDCIQGIRMNYYPPCEHASKVMGLTPHSDATGLTLLIQVNEVQGLQIKKNGKWVPIKPIPGAIIINIGDVLEILSNGEYSSIEHRAVVNPEKERLSIAGFHSPNMIATIGPFPDLVKEGGAKYKTVNVQDYLKLIVSSKLDGKSLLDHMKIAQ
ncbi:S-norcoclaurine synthase 1-like [Actinidia eriantha]|uniref:S-norcoclaurine synthase 1-like n=1 Tax=Actinidia eriantha TaxID=165200 RepID=UPI0025887D50|nr:S-norcoclaurine synthase 1-like [Actinidia eriantha]